MVTPFPLPGRDKASSFWQSDDRLRFALRTTLETGPTHLPRRVPSLSALHFSRQCNPRKSRTGGRLQAFDEAVPRVRIHLPPPNNLDCRETRPRFSKESQEDARKFAYLCSWDGFGSRCSRMKHFWRFPSLQDRRCDASTRGIDALWPVLYFLNSFSSVDGVFSRHVADF